LIFGYFSEWCLCPGGAYAPENTVAGQVQINSEYFDLDSGLVMFHIEAKMEKGVNLPLF
jgi:hypothetical protein